MRICVISDLHIGAGKEFDTFNWNIDDFLLMLEYVEKKFDIRKIVLNGDIFDLYQHNFSEILEHNKQLFQYFAQEKFIFLRGNHDAGIPDIFDNFLITNKQGKKIYFEHGHLADFMNGTHFGRKLGQWGYRLLKNFMHMEIVQNIFMKIVQLNDQIDRIPRKYDTYKYLNYALKLLRNYDFVVLSHTHKLEEHKTYYLNQKKIYVNTGSCSLGRFQALVLDTENLKYTTLKLGKKAVARRLVKIKNPDIENQIFVNETSELIMENVLVEQ